MHAVVVTVTLTPAQFEASTKILRENVIPQVRQAPGLVKGYWTASADRTSGVSVVVFKTQADADNAAKMVRTNPPPPGVTMSSVEIREVVAEA